MSSTSLYDIAIPSFTRVLKTFDHILTKAEAFAKEKGLDPDAEYFSARLIADQLPLSFQVQNATKAVNLYVGFLTGKPGEPFPDTEKTFADLHARITAALELLKTVKPDVANALGDSAKAEFAPGGNKFSLSVKQAVLQQGIPNTIFHLTTGYSILRSKGVPLGKADFISNFLAN